MAHPGTRDDLFPDHPADQNPQNCRRCTVDGCRRWFYARGLCKYHYERGLRGVPVVPVKRDRRRLPPSFKIARC